MLEGKLARGLCSIQTIGAYSSLYVLIIKGHDRDTWYGFGFSTGLRCIGGLLRFKPQPQCTHTMRQGLGQRAVHGQQGCQRLGSVADVPRKEGGASLQSRFGR